MFMATETAVAVERATSASLLKSSYDWKHIFEEYAQYPVDVRTRQTLAAHYDPSHVQEVIAFVDGENDGADWVGVFYMQDGRYLTVRAGCDYTGWGCRENGSSDVADKLVDAVAFGLTKEERTRLADQLNNLVPARVAS
jgi:hypothetical protein